MINRCLPNGTTGVSAQVGASTLFPNTLLRALPGSCSLSISQLATPVRKSPGEGKQSRSIVQLVDALQEGLGGAAAVAGSSRAGSGAAWAV